MCDGACDGVCGGVCVMVCVYTNLCLNKRRGWSDGLCVSHLASNCYEIPKECVYNSTIIS